MVVLSIFSGIFLCKRWGDYNITYNCCYSIDHLSCIINRLLYSVMHNMERYCTRPYCIENPYWNRRPRRLVQYGFSIQYRLVHYLSILYIVLYNNLLVLTRIITTFSIKTNVINTYVNGHCIPHQHQHRSE